MDSDETDSSQVTCIPTQTAVNVHVPIQGDIVHPTHYIKIWYFDLVYSKEKNHVPPQNEQWSALLEKSFGEWGYAAC